MFLAYWYEYLIRSIVYTSNFFMIYVAIRNCDLSNLKKYL
jgi:hypothetical protein